MSETYPENREELKKQLKLWRASDKKSPWYDYPPKVKVRSQTNEKFSFLNLALRLIHEKHVVWPYYCEMHNINFYFLFYKNTCVFQTHHSACNLHSRFYRR